MSFLNVPIKKGPVIDIATPLMRFIRQIYGDFQANNQKEAVTKFAELRNSAVNLLEKKNETSIEAMKRYYDLLCLVDDRLNLSENGARIDFTWRNVFGNRKTIKVPSAAFEKAAILFNIAAVHTELASKAFEQPTDENLKEASKRFQIAAGIFLYLSTTVTPGGFWTLSIDLHPDCLQALYTLMLAQSQEVIFLKAVQDFEKKEELSYNVIAKIAQQAQDLYTDVLTTINFDSVKGIWPKDWLTFLQFKLNIVISIAQYYQSLTCGEEKAYGEQIRRLQIAKSHMETLKEKKSPLLTSPTYGNYYERIRTDLESSMKANESVHRLPLPDVSCLPPIQKALLTKEIAIKFPLCGEVPTDPFGRLIPIKIQNALIAYNRLRQQCIHQRVNDLREASDVLTTVLVSMNLPAALDEITEIPASLLQNAEKVRQMGGITKLREMLKDLADLTESNENIWKESSRLLKEEEETDLNLRKQRGDNLKRTPSKELTKDWIKEMERFQSALKQATQSDKVLKDRCAKYEHDIALLSSSDEEIKKKFPEKPMGTPSSSEHVATKDELRRLCDQANELKTKRKHLETEIKNIKLEDPLGVLTVSLNDEADIDFVCEALMKQLLSPVQEQIDFSIGEQTELISLIHSANEKLKCDSQQITTNLRAQYLSNLTAAYEQFEQLHLHLKEGRTFHVDLTENLLKLQTQINDFVMARETEKEEWVRAIQSH